MAEIVITSSVLILVITAVRYLLRGELSLRVQYALWLLAAVRLLVPGTLFTSAFSVLNAAPTVELPDRGSVYLSDQGVTAQEPPPRIVTNAADRTIQYAWYYAPGDNEPSSFQADEPLPDWAADYTTVPASRILPTPKGVLTAVWYIGMAAMGGWFLWVNLSFRRRLRAERRRVEVPNCPLPVYAAESIPSPCLVGLFRPAVYVTPACLEDENRLRHVLAHELAHWRHKDPLWSLVRCLCLTVYWFHPLVWLAASLSRRDCELACDERALKDLGEEARTAYGRTLIGLIEVSASPVHLLQTATTMVDRKGGVKERLLFISKKPRVAVLTGVAAVLIAAVAAACTFTGAVEPTDSPEAAYATVEEALADIPEELSPTGEGSFLSGITALTLENDMGPYGPKLEEGELFRGYWRIYLGLSSSLSDPLGWMASVYRMDQAAYDRLIEVQGMTGRRQDAYWECFARDDASYYLIYAPLKAPELRSDLTEGAELREKLVAWMKEAVLSAQGVTAVETARFDYTYHPAGLSPAELEWFNAELFKDIVLINGIKGESVTVIGGYHGSDGLLHLQYYIDNKVSYGWATLREEGDSYVLVSNWYPTIEPFKDWDPDVSFTGTAEEAFRLLRENDLTARLILADSPEMQAWREFGYNGSGLEWTLLDVDGDGEPELLGQYAYDPDTPNGAAVLNAVFDFRNGLIHCWRFDNMDGSEFQYPLFDGRMVHENHFSDAVTYRIFRYTPKGEQEDLGSLAYTPAGGLFGDNGDPASWQVDGEPVTEEEFNSALEERITSWKLAAGFGSYHSAIPDFNTCRDDILMYFMLNVADGAYAEGAGYAFGERFLSRPGDILNTMTSFRGVEVVRWPDFEGDAADWLARELVSEFKVMRPPEDAERFLAALGQFSDEDYGGMARDVREAWDSYVQP